MNVVDLTHVLIGMTDIGMIDTGMTDDMDQETGIDIEAEVLQDVAGRLIVIGKKKKTL